MEKTIINRNWYFKFGENKGDEINIKLNEYSLIGLPHSFGIPYYGEMISMLAMAHITRNLIVIVIFKTAVFYWSFGGNFSNCRNLSQR